MCRVLWYSFFQSFLLSCSFLFLPATVVSQNTGKDTLHCKGSVAITGLIQTGDENRTIFSVLSTIKLGTGKYEMEPLTSIAYSNKPHKQVEGEYLENIIFRYHQNKKLYPAAGFVVEHSYLRKISIRSTMIGVVVYNVLNKKKQFLKLALGYSHEYTRYTAGAFVPPIDGKNVYSRKTDQLYTRIKGEHSIDKVKVSYDISYQASLNKISDRRWFVIGHVDYMLSKYFSLRVSLLNSFEYFRATSVSQNNFRLTYGINFQF